LNNENIEKWNLGFDDKDYDFLNKEFGEWVENFDNPNKVQKVLIT
jgi:hypothetical protein